ncbi:MAG TPA: hypothetical protein VNH11_22510 [Pirellulales bacterium]|nr:hypothetical protein [Pirellulales bacterium]
MDFVYQVVRLWERPAEQLLVGEPGLAPLAMLGQLAEGATVEDGLVAVAQRRRSKRPIVCLDRWRSALRG